MHVVRVQLEEAPDSCVDLARQAARDALAHHRALLARNRRHVGLDFGGDRLAKSHIEVLPRPSGLGGRPVAQLEVFDTELPREFEPPHGASAARLASSVEAAPQWAANGRETSEWPNSMLFTCASGRIPLRSDRHALRRGSACGAGIRRSMSSRHSMRWKNVASGQDCTKADHAARSASSIGADRQRRSGRNGHVIRSHASRSKTRSTRSQWKSRRSFLRRGSVRSRFR